VSSSTSFAVRRVKGLLPGRAAAVAGVQVGDRVLAIGDVRLAGRDLESILDLLAGPPGAALRLEIQRGGARLRLPLRLGE
jgi:C-terminal processing protease CtpA/Prc